MASLSEDLGVRVKYMLWENAFKLMQWRQMTTLILSVESLNLNRSVSSVWLSIIDCRQVIKSAKRCNYTSTVQAVTRASLHLTGSHGDTFLISFGSFLWLFRLSLFSHLQCHSDMADRGNTPGGCCQRVVWVQLLYKVSPSSRLLRSWYKNDILQQLSSHLHSVWRGTTVGKVPSCLGTLLAAWVELQAAWTPLPLLHARRSGLRFCGTPPMVLSFSCVYGWTVQHLSAFVRFPGSHLDSSILPLPSLALRYAAHIPARTALLLLPLPKFKPTFKAGSPRPFAWVQPKAKKWQTLPFLVCTVGPFLCLLWWGKEN